MGIKDNIDGIVLHVIEDDKTATQTDEHRRIARNERRLHIALALGCRATWGEIVVTIMWRTFLAAGATAGIVALGWELVR